MNIKKITAVIILCIALTVTSISWVFASGFSDISDPEVYISVETLKGLGVLTGVSATEFSPDSSISRAEACAIMVRIMGLTSKLNTYARKTLFYDVTASDWYTSYVNLAYGQNIINGYGDGYFGPDDPLTYGQVATMIVRLLGYTSSDIGNIWPYDYTNFCEDEGISSGIDVDPMDNISRGETAIMFYRTLSASTKQGKTYYSTTNTVSSVSNGIAFNKSGEEAGFIADSNNFEDIIIGSASASQIIDTDGNKYRITGTARVIYGTNSTLFTSGGYAQVNANRGEKARLYYNSSDNISYIYIMNMSDSDSSSSSELDNKVQGYISAASPSISAASSVTLGGYNFTVDSKALGALSNYKIGSNVTLILSDDNKVVDVKSGSADCEMIGILAENGKSVTLVGSGITLSASSVKCDTTAYGNLVSVSMSDMNTIKCTKLSTYSNLYGELNISDYTFKGTKISGYASIFESVAYSSLYSLEGEKGKASTDLSAIFWTDSIDNVYAKYIHYDKYGNIDILVLEDITGNAYTYGNGDYIQNGISVSSAFGNSFEDSISLSNSSGNSKCVYTGFSNEGYVGVALKTTSSNNQKVTKVNIPSYFYYTSEETEIYSNDNIWYINNKGTEFRISEDLEVYQKTTDKWTTGVDNLMSLLSDNYSFVFYYDKAPEDGGQIRIAVIY